MSQSSVTCCVVLQTACFHRSEPKFHQAAAAQTQLACRSLSGLCPVQLQSPPQQHLQTLPTHRTQVIIRVLLRQHTMHVTHQPGSWEQATKLNSCKHHHRYFRLKVSASDRVLEYLQKRAALDYVVRESVICNVCSFTIHGDNLGSVFAKKIKLLQCTAYCR